MLDPLKDEKQQEETRAILRDKGTDDEPFRFFLF